MNRRPTETEYAPSCQGYISLVPEDNVVAVLERQREELAGLAGAVRADRENCAYAPGKWTVREVIGHLLDAERAFGFRAFCVSRGEAAALPGFDENAYVANSPYAGIPLAELVREFAVLREGNLLLFHRLDESAWSRLGTANGKVVSVRAIAYVLAGHFRHHVNILRDRYGVTAG